MLVRVLVPATGWRVRPACLPPLVALAGVLLSGLAPWLKAVAALACLPHLVAAIRPVRRLPALHVDLAASGVLRWRAAGRAGLEMPAAGCRVGSNGIRLPLAGCTLLALPGPRQAATGRVLARALLRQQVQSVRWRPVLPRRWRLAGFGYNRALRVTRCPPCPPS